MSNLSFLLYPFLNLNDQMYVTKGANFANKATYHYFDVCRYRTTTFNVSLSMFVSIPQNFLNPSHDHRYCFLLNPD